MKIRGQNLRDLITILFVMFTLFIASPKTDSIFSILYVISLMVIYILYYKKEIFNNKLYLPVGIIFCMLIIDLIFSKYGITDAIKKFTFLILAFIEYYLLKNKYTNREELQTKYFLRVFIKIISVWLLIFIPYNLITGKSGFDFSFPINIDKNYTAISIFLFFCLCLKFKNTFGIIISIIFGLMLKSRLFILGIISYILIKFFIYISKKYTLIEKIFHFIENFKTKHIVLLIILLTMMMLFISYGMVYFIPLSSIKEHNQSLNDNSNAIRVRANVYALETIIRNPKLILYGYDQNIKKELGVEIPDKAPIYLNFRLVQPHNFLLNLILRYGIILTIIYLIILARILSKYWNKENLPIILTYLMMNMIMHSLLSSAVLIFFLFVLKINEITSKPIKKKSENLYVCYSPYHLLITLLKAIKNKDKPDIILAADHDNNVLTTDEMLINKLKKCDFLNNIIIYDVSNQQKAILKEKFTLIKKYLFVINETIENKILFEKYKNIYLYTDALLIGRILNYKNIKYHLIEDGTDCFVHNQNLVKSRNFKILFKKYILGINRLGESKNIIDIEVNNKNGVFIENKNIIELPKKELFKNISMKDQKLLKDIFMTNIDVENLNNKTIIITQPLSEDGIVKTEKMKIDLYKSIIKKYCQDEEVVIKTHPRENTNYSKLKNVLVITDNFPLEMLNLYTSIHFKKIITISSTSIQLIDNCDKKEFLGWEYLNNFKKVYDEK